MRKQNFNAVLNANTYIKFFPSVALAQPVFYPTVDGIAVFDDYVAHSASGAFARIPYLIGNADKDDGFYRIVAALSNTTLTE